MYRLAQFTLIQCSLMLLLIALSAQAGEKTPSDQPKGVPLTRDEVKAALEDLKNRQPRLPLPPAAEGEQMVNNGRMRERYLPAELRVGGGSREPDPNMKFEQAFATMLFWITSRVNNCTYCLGHQENKLLAAGVAENTIAALDGSWDNFTPAERAAFALARKLTYEPHLVRADDIDAVRKHYDDQRVLEMVYLVSRYNATNRWTDGLGIPTENHRVYLTPTSKDFAAKVTGVAPFDESSRPGAFGGAPNQSRGKLEPPDEVLAKLAANRSREPRLPLVSADEVKKLLSADAPDEPATPLFRLLGHFPVHGKQWMLQLTAARDNGKLKPELKAQIAYTAARQDRAWYALAAARARLHALGYDDDRMFALDDLAKLPAKESARRESWLERALRRRSGSPTPTSPPSASTTATAKSRRSCITLRWPRLSTA